MEEKFKENPELSELDSADESVIDVEIPELKEASTPVGERSNSVVSVGGTYERRKSNDIKDSVGSFDARNQYRSSKI